MWSCNLCLSHGNLQIPDRAHILLLYDGRTAVQVCNHRFHSECLQRWGDMSCPVCRYCSPSSTADSRCSTCNTSQVIEPLIRVWAIWHICLAGPQPFTS